MHYILIHDILVNISTIQKIQLFIVNHYKTNIFLVKFARTRVKYIYLKKHIRFYQSCKYFFDVPHSINKWNFSYASQYPPLPLFYQ